MSLLSRLVDPAVDEDKVPVHEFCSLIGEWVRGAAGIDKGYVAGHLGLVPPEADSAQAIRDHIVAGDYDRVMLEDVLQMGEGNSLEVGKKKLYTIKNIESRLLI